MNVQNRIFKSMLTLLAAVLFVWIGWESRAGLSELSAPITLNMNIFSDLDSEEKALSAKGLNDICLSKENWNKSFCLGYLLGVSDMTNLTSGWDICARSNEMDGEQLAAIYSDAVKDHPEYWNKYRGIMAVYAFQKKFPCD